MVSSEANPLPKKILNSERLSRISFRTAIGILDSR